MAPQGPRPEGTVMTVEFELDGEPFVALNGGPDFTFNEAVSFQVFCETQEEVDSYWDNLADGGEEGPCGWLKDKFGLSWQVIPRALPRLLAVPTPKGAACHGRDDRDGQARNRRAEARSG